MTKHTGKIPSGNKLLHILYCQYADQMGVTLEYTLTDDKGKQIRLNTEQPCPWFLEEYSAFGWHQDSAENENEQDVEK